MELENFNIRSLRSQMENNIMRSESGRYFLPNISLATIFTLVAIEKAVQELRCQPDERIGLATAIYGEGKRTFAVLVWMKEEDFIVTFRNHDALDRRLPLSETYAKEIAPKFGTRLAHVEQWMLLPFEFPPNMCEHHWEVNKDQIIPFIGESEDVGKGGFGDVYQVSILPSQQAFYSKEWNNVQVIRKRLRSKGTTKQFTNEKMCLRLLNQLKHPNIICLLGSYTYQGEHNFLFPCVDMDLKCFFQREERFGDFKWDFTFYSALHGLSSALSKTHQLYLNQAEHKVDFRAIGYHHDIRPANILVSKETFILADFGLGNLKSADAQSHTPWKWTIGDYLAPECMDENQIPQDVNRAIDVWAFGCLTAEVATYMQKRALGVKEFNDKRLLPGRRAGWEDCGFYDHDGNVKDEVKQWLETLPKDQPDESLIRPLVNSSLQALTGDVLHRPKIASISKVLTFLSLKAHFIAAHKQFSDHLGPDPTSELHKRPTANNLWFLQERFRAWGRTLTLDKNEPAAYTSKTLSELYNKSISTMATLFHELENWLSKSPISEYSDAQYVLENRVDQLVEILWDLLPANLRRLAQDYWHQAILCTDDKGVLKDVDHALKSRYTVYDIADAMAIMRKIRLEMLQPDSLEGADEAFTIKLKDVILSSKEGRHTFGRYQNKIPVLVERMRFTPAWKNVNLVQRKLVMGLKARSLSIDPKPKGLRTMKCIGAFEEPDEEDGYGFVYQCPEGTESDPTTLLQRLTQEEKNSKHHPLLGDKFELAFALANFLKEFHTIGWLHENLNSHNILFFKVSNSNEADDLPFSNGLSQPYVVGLQKSRPDGSFWQTDGPATDINLQDYQHPDYAVTGRYRLAFDYYSLGIVLLEIGLWRPLGSLLSKFRDLGLADMKPKLTEMCQTRLGVKMGAVYRDVVLRCIDGSLERRLSETGGGVRDEESSNKNATLEYFMERVVEPLERLARALA